MFCGRKTKADLVCYFILDFKLHEDRAVSDFFTNMTQHLRFSCGLSSIVEEGLKTFVGNVWLKA